MQGYQVSSRKFKMKLESGFNFDKIDKIIVTHQDIDHIGGISDIIKESNHKILVFAHEDDKPFIEGEMRLNKITPERKQELEKQIKLCPKSSVNQCRNYLKIHQKLE